MITSVELKNNKIYVEVKITDTFFETFILSKDEAINLSNKLKQILLNDMGKVLKNTK